MKTTKGKTKPAESGERICQIYRLDGNKLLTVVSAKSLKMALKTYYEQTLAGYGYTAPLIKGNVLICKNKQGENQKYRAIEAYQSA